MPLQKMKRMYPPRPKELAGLPDIEKIKTASEFIEVLKDEVSLLVNIVKEYDKIYAGMTQENEAKLAFGRVQEQLKSRINSLNYIINYGTGILAGKEPEIIHENADNDPVRQSEENITLFPDLSEVLPETPVVSEIKSEEKKESTFDRNRFVNNLAKEISQFARNFIGGHPKTDTLKLLGEELRQKEKSGEISSDEAQQIINDSLAQAGKGSAAGYMRGVDKVLYKQNLLPKFE